MVSERGFFSPEAADSRHQLRQVYQEVFEIAEQLTQLLIRPLRDAELDEKLPKNMAMYALAAKSLELFQCSILLLERGCIPAAKILCRALIETVYKLVTIHLSTNAIDLYVQQAEQTRLQKLKSVVKYKQKHKNSGVAPGIEAEIQCLSKKKNAKTEPYEWAKLAQMEDFHTWTTRRCRSTPTMGEKAFYDVGDFGDARLKKWRCSVPAHDIAANRLFAATGG